MSSYNSIILNNIELINSFNQPMSLKREKLRINNDYYPSKIKKVIPLLQQGYKNAMSIKAQYLNNNLKKNINQRLLENIGLSNDSKIKRFNNLFKPSTIYNDINFNYYSKRRTKFDNSKTMRLETPQIYDRNDYNNLGKKNWSSFSFTVGYNKVNYMKINNNYENNLKNNCDIKFSNLRDGNDTQSNKLNGSDLNQLKSYGIKYCIDENGNPINIVDIKIKNKNPIAYIIQKKDKNILVDLYNNIINPNNNGDYNLPQKPYFIIRKYNVQYPELRCNDIKEKNDLNYPKLNNQNNNYYSIDKNDSNQKLFNIINNAINIERIRRKIYKSCNLDYSNIINMEKDQNTFLGKIQNKDKDRKIFLCPDIKEKLNSNNLIKNSLKKKRKYIFINKIIEDNRSMQLKLKISNDNIINNTINSLNNKSQRKDNENKFNTIIKESWNKNNENSDKLIIKDLNKVKNKSNNLKEIKYFTKKEIKNLEFKFERKYKNNKKNNVNPGATSFFNNFKSFYTTENQKEKNNTIKVDKNYIKPENPLKNKTRLLVEKINNLNLKKNKQQGSSYSLNEFMFNNIEKQQDKLKTNNNMLNTLSTFSHSFVSPPTENASFTTIQNIQNELNKNKKNIKLGKIKDVSHIKKFKTFKFHLMTKLNSKKIFHKRIKTDNINNGEKKYKFFKSLTESYKKNGNNFSFKQGNNTGINISLKNSQHNSCNDTNKVINFNNIDINNNVCKCPYCHHLFYS